MMTALPPWIFKLNGTIFTVWRQTERIMYNNYVYVNAIVKNFGLPIIGSVYV